MVKNETNKKLKYIPPTIIKQTPGQINKFGRAQFEMIKKNIDGVEVKKLIKKFGSPLFVISENKIRKNQRNALRVFSTRYPKVQFAWSYKTNYLNAVCEVFHQEKSWAEVVSEFEYDKAIELKVKGENIIFNGPEKSVGALIKAIKNNSKIHVDSFDELNTIFEIAENKKLNPKLAIRINMDTGIYPKWDRFGFNYENGEALEAIEKIIQNKKCKLVGLHTHIGTFNLSTEPYKIAAKVLSKLYKTIILKYKVKPEYIDLGGGFASKNTLIGSYLPTEEFAPTIEQYADAIISGIKEEVPTKDLPKLILETGRALIDDAGFLLTSVIANKRLTSGRKAIVVDAGVNILFTSFWYKHKTNITEESQSIAEETSIYGPLCMNIDCIRDSIMLPTQRIGSTLLIENVGAYNMTQWMQFISMRPNVVMILKDGTVEIIRKKEGVKTIQQQEKMPKKLKKKK